MLRSCVRYVGQYKGLLSRLFAGVLPAVLLPGHMLVLYHYWHEFGRRVHRKYCSCSCWDTVFKGPYESGVASYKHVYFNATQNSLSIWALTVTCIITLYECSKRLIFLLLNRRLRFSFALLFCSALPSHYYTWWVFFNYWNDDFYEQWNHQLLFTVSELISTCVVMHLADRANDVAVVKVAVVVVIGALHAITAAMDQFIQNVIRGEGQAHQIARDLMFMVPDVMHVGIPLLLLYRRRQRCLKLDNLRRP